MPELLLGPVRLVEPGSGAAAEAGFGEGLSARRDSLEPRGVVSLEGESASARRQGAARRQGRDGHGAVEGARQAVGGRRQ